MFAGQNDLSFGIYVVRQREAASEEKDCPGPRDKRGSETYSNTRLRKDLGKRKKLTTANAKSQSKEKKKKKNMLVSLRNEKISRGGWSLENNKERTRL